jgi:MFS superfamily sulfate permease-like transporter
MNKVNKDVVPTDGFQGLKDHWRSDLISAFSVALVALPLGLGIAMASNVPPMAGVIAAIIGGLFATFIRGSYIAINGPAAGLIVVILTAMEALGEFKHVLGAIVVSGAIQILMGLAKLGKLGKLFPNSVIHGMLAAIGVIIFGKQAHVALGQTTDAKSSLDVILAIPESVSTMDVKVTKDKQTWIATLWVLDSRLLLLD